MHGLSYQLYYEEGTARYKQLLKEAEDYRSIISALKTQRQPQSWWQRVKRNLSMLLV